MVPKRDGDNRGHGSALRLRNAPESNPTCPCLPKRRFSRFTALSAPSAEVLVAKRLQLSFGLTELHSDW